MREYYEAYDDRYRQVHALSLDWLGTDPSPVVMDVLNRYAISRSDKLLEIGCGEGRDAHFLLRNGFDVLATDVSAEAICYCRSKALGNEERFRVLDCVTERTDERYDFIYAVAVLHMLVQDRHRDAFYAFIRDALKLQGIALVCSMGDGTVTRSSDITKAFELQERIHEATGTVVKIAGTSCRIVDDAIFEREIYRNGLTVLEKGITETVPGFDRMMYAVIKKA